MPERQQRFDLRRHALERELPAPQEKVQKQLEGIEPASGIFGLLEARAPRERPIVGVDRRKRAVGEGEEERAQVGAHIALHCLALYFLPRLEVDPDLLHDVHQ